MSTDAKAILVALACLAAIILGWITFGDADLQPMSPPPSGVSE